MATSQTVWDFYEKFLPASDQFTLAWTVFAFVIILLCMMKFIYSFHKNRAASLIIYSVVAIVLSNVWFWVSYVPGVVVYLSCGGILN